MCEEKRCPTCHQILGEVPYEDQCEMKGCHDWAVYEAWFRVRDFSGTPTGLIQKFQVCEEHVKLSIAFEKNGEEAIKNAN